MNVGGAIRVLVADDQAIIREGLVTILGLVDDITVVGEAVDGIDAIEITLREKPHVVLMDLRTPRLDGVDATTRLSRDAPSTAVLVLTTHADDESIVAALRAGARGYLTKDAGRIQLASAIRAVAQGQTVFAPDIGARIIGAATTSAPADPISTLADRCPTLTARELEVLTLMTDGLDNRQIATRLFVGVSTVKSHVNSIFAKLGVTDRAAAIALALDRA